MRGTSAGPRPPTMVIFGATGSLTSGKVVPALFSLHRKGRLPHGTRILGAARRDLTDDGFRDHLAAALGEKGAPGGPGGWTEFARAIGFVRADVSDASGLEGVKRALAADGGGGRLYYLALAPWLYPAAIASLIGSGLAGSAGGDGTAWRRVVVEKPFGHDLASARALNQALLSGFDESQVFRIDHWLGKETVQNILVFRFANVLFEPLWHRNLIDHVQITVAESGRVGDRGAYYDGAGVLRDMFQNHLMQLLALVAMEAPGRFEATALRNEKVKLLDAVRRIEPQDAPRALVTGQYEGYRKEPGVRRDTCTPTFAALRLFVDNWRWQGVPFYLRSGKGLAARVSEVLVQLQAPPHDMFDLPAGRALAPNRISLGIQPDEGVHIRFETKVPDRGMELRSSTLVFHFGDQPGGAAPDAYERLLLDALAGDASLFMRSDEIERAWSIIDPLTGVHERTGAQPPHPYAVGSWGPAAADAFIAADGRAWDLETALRDH